MSDIPPGVDIAAAREHTTTSRRTRAHVIICHDLNSKSRSLLDLFLLATTVDAEICAAVARDLTTLRAELDGIEAFARGQLRKLDRE